MQQTISANWYRVIAERLCESILKLAKRFSRRCLLKKVWMTANGAPAFSCAGHCVQWSTSILAILVECNNRNISVKLF